MTLGSSSPAGPRTCAASLASDQTIVSVCPASWSVSFDATSRQILQVSKHTSLGDGREDRPLHRQRAGHLGTDASGARSLQGRASMEAGLEKKFRVPRWLNQVPAILLGASNSAFARGYDQRRSARNWWIPTVEARPATASEQRLLYCIRRRSSNCASNQAWMACASATAALLRSTSAVLIGVAASSPPLA